MKDDLSRDLGTCDLCGAPATSLARDMKRTDQPGDRDAAYAPVGQLKRGCDLHPAVSLTFDQQGNYEAVGTPERAS